MVKNKKEQQQIKKKKKKQWKDTINLLSAEFA